MKQPMRAPHPSPAAGGRHAGRRNDYRRFVAAGLLVLLTLVVTLDTLVWFGLERQLDRRLRQIEAAAQTHGWHLSAEAGTRGGWPLAATLTLRHPTLDAPARSPLNPLGWSGERATLAVSFLRPQILTILAGGTQTVTFGMGADGPSVLRFWGASIALRLAGRPGSTPPEGVLLSAEALHVAVPGSGPDGIAQIAGASARLRWSDEPARDGSSVGLSVALRDISPPRDLFWRFEPEPAPSRQSELASRIVPRARLEATIVDGHPDGDVARLLRISEASVDWDDGGLAAGGEARMSPGGQPDGHFILAITHADAVIGHLAESRLLSQGGATALRAVVGLIGESEPGPRVHLPIDLHDGQFSMGEIPLLRLPSR